MNTLEKYLTNQHNNALRAKEWNKKQGQKEVKNAVWKTHCKGYISAFDYGEICRKNNQLAFYE